MPDAVILRSRPGQFLSAVVLSLVIVAGHTQSLFAQTVESASADGTESSEIATTSFGSPAIVALPKLPAAFLKAVPESVDDLRTMESHVQSLVSKLTETTVALTVGNAQGSGVIVSEDGYVLTAAHVSGSPGRRVGIRLSDGTRAFGRSLGHNKTLDASLIKIEKPERKWPHVAMAQLEDIQPGDWSVVMGHPGGYQRGRPPVFRLGRVIHVDDQVIQTDNELVGGDSGGPLFDMYGRVIGINSRIGPNTSFNLHTPINAYTDYWDRLVDSEEFILHSGALLGVQGERTEQGLKLTKVRPDEPAGRAGIKEGDILIRFQSEQVRGIEHLIELVGQERPGRRVTVVVLRDQEMLEFTVRLGRKR